MTTYSAGIIEFRNLDVAILYAESLGFTYIDEDDFTYWTQVVPGSVFWQKFSAYADDSFKSVITLAFDKTF